MANMKDILVLQIKSQELDRKEQKLSRQEEAAKHTSLIQSIKDNSLSVPGKMPLLPKLDMKKDWPNFWHVIQHYVSKKKYSVSKIRKLKHVETLGNYNNVEAPLAVAGTLVQSSKARTSTSSSFRMTSAKGKVSRCLLS